MCYKPAATPTNQTAKQAIQAPESGKTKDLNQRKTRLYLLPKLGVASSSLVFRSMIINELHEKNRVAHFFCTTNALLSEVFYIFEP